MSVDPAKVQLIFSEVVDMTPEERAVAINERCANDNALRRRIESLLAAYDQPDSLLTADFLTNEYATNESSYSADVSSRTFLGSGDSVGQRYQLDKKIGEGGMGEVWVAKQTNPVVRNVAIKLIKRGMDSNSVLQRFEQERQALAIMDHPNIAGVLDGGMAQSGQPYFVMELVNGLPLLKFCDQQGLSPRERLELFIPICNAVQHAHQKGIIHRDLKPANILVTMIDGRPVPKVIDFGVAKATQGKLTDATVATGFGAVVGTLEYMSPEQAGYSGDDIDTRADIYSLGVILYELLTGLRPIDARRLKQAALTEMIRMVQEDEPSKPSTRLSSDDSLPSLAASRKIEPGKLIAMLRGELDWIVLKCLEKQRSMRYETANLLAKEIQRFLDDEPVEARPHSRRYRFGKFLRRNKGLVAAISLVALALIAGIIGTSFGLYRANESAKLEATANEEAQDKRIEAEKQRTRAEEREQQAIEAVKRFGDAVADNPELKNNPKLETLRKELLKEPLSFFGSLKDRLETDVETKPESLSQLSNAVFELARLTNEIGDKRDAIKAYEQAISSMQRVVDRAPENDQWQFNLANCYQNVGILQKQTGNTQQALASFESGGRLYKQLIVANPDVAKYHAGLANYHEDLGVMFSDTDRTDEALAAFEESVGIYERAMSLDPENAENKSGLANVYNNIGRTHRQTGNNRQGLAAFKSGLGILGKLVESNPDNDVFQNELAQNHANIGALQDNIGDSQAATEAYLAAKEIGAKLLARNPTVVDFQRTLASYQSNLGTLYGKSGQSAKSAAAFEECDSLLKDLVKSNPSVNDFRSSRASNLVQFSILKQETGEFDAAIELLADAAAIQEQLIVDAPEFGANQNSLVETLITMGLLYQSTGRPADSKAACERGVKIAKRLIVENPTIVTYKRNLARLLNNLGLIASDSGSIDEALKLYTSASEILSGLQATNPNDSIANALAICQSNIGGLLHQQEKYDDSIAAHKESLAISKRLSQSQPDNTDLLSSVAMTLDNLGIVYQSMGKFTLAIDSYEEGQKVIEQLASENPDRPQFQLSLANSFDNIGRLCRQTGEIEKAVASSENAVETLRELAKKYPSVAVFSHRLGGSLHNLAWAKIGDGLLVDAKKLIQEAIEYQEKAISLDDSNPRFRQFLRNHLGQLRSIAKELSDDDLYEEARQKVLSMALTDLASPSFDNMSSGMDPNSANQINMIVWELVKLPAPNSDLELTANGLTRMRWAAKQYPSTANLNTLGVAEYRKENYLEAIAAATTCLERTKDEMGLDSQHPSDLAIVAMSHFKSGDTEKASEFFKDLSTAMKLETFAKDLECISFFEEANALMQPSAKD